MKYVNLMGLDEIDENNEAAHGCHHHNVEDEECLDCGKQSILVLCDMCGEYTMDLDPCC